MSCANKMSVEEMKKESEEITKKEMNILTEKIKNNPELLKPNFNKCDSSDESSDDSSYSSKSSSSSSSSSKSSHRKRKSKKKLPNFAPDFLIYKKEREIDKLEEQNYHKTIELSNLMLEFNKAIEDNSILHKRLLEREILVDTITKFINFNKENPVCKIKEETLKLDSLGNKLMIVEKEFLEKKSFNEQLLSKLKALYKTDLGNYYVELVEKHIVLLEKNFKENNESVYYFEQSERFNEKAKIIIMILCLVGLFLFFKDFPYGEYLDL